MTLKEYMEKEREALQFAIPKLKDRQTNYFEIIDNLLKVIEDNDIELTYNVHEVDNS